MPHSVYTRNLGRSHSWRKATVRSLSTALLTHEQIHTTLAKAKETQRLVEKLITLGKTGSLSARRRAVSLLNEPAVVARLFSEVAPRFSQRQGGYTRILHGNYRPGDGASMAVLELVERAAPKPPAEPKIEPKPKAAEKPKIQPPKKEETPKPEKPKGGFLGGLRSFFKKDRKDRPNNP